MTYHYFQQATEAYLEAGFYDQARVAYLYAVDRGLSAEEVPDYIDFLIDKVKAGALDDEIDAIRQANVEARTNRNS